MSLSTKVYGGSATLFVGLGAAFAVRMAAGGDPALAASSTSVAPAPPTVVRQVIVTRRVNVDGLSAAELRRRGISEVMTAGTATVRPRAGAGRAMAQSAAPAAAEAPGTAAVGRRPAAAPEAAGGAAPAPAAPAPTTYAPVPETPAAGAPAPAPVTGISPEQASAPAPVVTRTS